MKAIAIEPNYFEVTAYGSWYSAARRNDGTYFVVNHQGRHIKDGSRIYLKVVKAIESEAVAK